MATGVCHAPGMSGLSLSDLPRPLILGIETSCDDTACAVLDGQGRVLASVVSSQIAPHRPYGGVVPEIASREHLRNWQAVSAEALDRAGVSLQSIDAVAATRGPGLVGSLLVGLTLGKSIAWGLDVPFFGVHHMEGHLFSPLLGPPGEVASEVPESFHGLVVSGGHSLIVEVSEHGAAIETIAQTRDDAMGEVFDKVGKRLGLDFPGGARVDALSERGDPKALRFSIARCSDGSLDFSFSGLKSQALLEIEKLEAQGVQTQIGPPEEDQQIATEVLNLLAGFRAAAVGQVLDRLRRRHREEPIEILAVSGGAAANRELRRVLEAWCQEEGIDLRLVSLALSGDNAAMIAHSALLRRRLGSTGDSLDTDAVSRLPMGPTS